MSTATPHAMTRLDIPTGIPFAVFRDRFEVAVPQFDLGTMLQLSEQNASWDVVERAVENNAPNGFVVFATIDATPLMALAGHTVRAVEYLMGNHIIAERMFRHDPDALLYAPLRILITDNPDGDAVFTLDQPSTAFAGFDNADIASVGIELDQKTAALLETLGVTPPHALQH